MGLILNIMTNEQILIKVIRKAIGNGYELPFTLKTLYDGDGLGLKGNWMNDKISVEEVIFSHDFAKAFWGEKEIDMHEHLNEDMYYTQDKWYIGGGYDGYGDYLRFRGVTWQYHLQQMVLEEDQIKYLEKFI